MASRRPLHRPLLSLSVPLLLVAGVLLAADRDGSEARVAAGSQAAGAGAGGAGGGGREGLRPAPRPTTTASTSTSSTTPPTTAPPVTEPPTTAPPTTSAPAAPVTEPDPGPPPAPAPAPEPEPQPAPPPPPAVTPPPSNGDIQALVAHHNARRAENGVAPLSYNGCLAGLANNWSNYLASILGLLHQGDLGGIVGSCLDWRAAGENVGYAATISELADGFWGSTGHRHNILDPSFTEIGVGAAYADGRIFITVLFGG